MFDFVSKHKRFLQIVLALTLIPFAFFGLESYTRVMGGAGDVAVADGMPISQREFAEELRRYLERLRNQVGQNVDLAELDSPELRAAILETMIAQRLVMAQVVKERLVMPKEQVVSSILASPDFRVDGKFSAERYAQYLRQRGLSDEGNVERLRVEIPTSRLASAVTGSAFVPRSVAERLVALLGERREISHVPVQIEPFLAKVKPSDAELKAFYEANLNDFRVPERVRAEYLVLSAQDMAAAETPTEAELKSAYEARAGVDARAGTRRASHILVESKEEADKLAAEARKSPQRFAELAKKHSSDTISAEKGGDLGFNPKGGSASKELDEAIFGMKEGDIGVVKSDFGFHVVRLVEIGKARPFEEMKKELAAEVAKQKAAKRFAEAADGFNNAVYEQSDSLKPAADKYKLAIRTSGWITRQPTPDMGPLAHPKVLNALFGAGAIKEKRNTDAVEVVPGMIVAARVAEHQPAAQRPFDEVKAEVTRRLSVQQAAALAHKEGAEKLAQLKKGDSAGLQWSAPRMISRREPTGLVPQALQKIMAADAGALPAYVGMERGEQGYVIYRVSKVVPGEAVRAEQSKEEVAALDRMAGVEQLEAYIGSLRARGKIEVNKANLEKK
jgi:peptidyl-prolyl cis-trans isomerase D